MHGNVKMRDRIMPFLNYCCNFSISLNKYMITGTIVSSMGLKTPRLFAKSIKPRSCTRDGNKSWKTNAI